MPSPHRGNVPYPRRGPRRGPGSITGSIAEEDEGSSGEDVAPGKLVVHDNRPASRSGLDRARSPTSTVPTKPSPLGVPSVNARSRPLSSTFGTSTNNANGFDSDDDMPAYGGGRGARRAASDVGAMGYRPPTGRQPLRRTFSDEQQNNGSPAPRAASDNSSVRNPPKKKGFLASISKFFKGPKKREGSIRSGRNSPPYGASSKGGAWHTRTESNVKRQSTLTGGRRHGGDDSSSDEDTGNLVSVANNRDDIAFTVANVGRADTVKRNSKQPVVSRLIPAAPKPTAADLGSGKRGGSQSTLTAVKPAIAAARATSPTPSRSKTSTAGATGSVSRSNTLKSTTSVNTTKSAGIPKKTRQNGTATRAAVDSQQAVAGRNIMNLVDMKTPPTMPEVPKAPKSQVTPQMELAKAPGSALIVKSQINQGTATSAGAPKLANGDITSQPARPMSRASSVKQIPKADEQRSQTLLPPSRSLQAPLKSALRPSSPSPSYSESMPPLSPPIEPPKSLFTIVAPGPVQLPREEPKPIFIPAAAPMPVAPKAAAATRAVALTPTKRNSFQSLASDGQSVYESAVEDDGAEAGESSSEEEDDMGYEVVENDNITRSGVTVGPPAIEKIMMRREQKSEVADDAASIMSGDTATHSRAPPSDAGSRATRRSRKSVRMAVPDSPTVEMAHPPSAPAANGPSVDREASPEVEKAQEQWSTRIGQTQHSDDEQDEEYMAARKGLKKNIGQWEAVAGKKKGSTKIKGLKA